MHPDFAGDIRRALNAWDPIGVGDLVDDEYDCLVVPLLRRLHDGADASQIADFLHDELRDHFGLDPARYDLGAFAAGVVASWVDAHRAS
ncbi:hypothetical protein AB0I55_10110 [Actinocatenispora sera]|uniref:hypothetical protein n=1 Tax=Actinocatenispora sera TaxID=390989 RepID=UPI0033EE165D